MDRHSIALGFLLLATLAAAPAHAANAAHTIVLVRHGNYVPDPNASPQLGPGLSPLGVAQAHLAGSRLAALPKKFDGLFVSPLQRARDSAAAMAEDFPARTFDVVDDLAECTPPGRGVPAANNAERQAQDACKAQLERVFARFFKPAVDEERADMLVCHGNVIRYLVARTLGVDTKAWTAMSVGHASMTTIRIEADGTVRIIAIGDVGHVPPTLRTGALGDPERSLALPAALTPP